jgi:hypothetical protein
MEKDWLEARLAEGRSIESIAREVGKHPSTVGLRRYGLATVRARRSAAAPRGPRVVIRECPHHGFTAWIRAGTGGRYRCKRCRSEHVSARRRRVKQLLVDEAGGRCILCGYDRHAGALQFHHLDPSTKSFALSVQGVARSLEKARAEAAKCVLICANCHAEVEGGVATIRL